MAKCDVCGKGTNTIRKHAYRGTYVTKRSLKTQKPNIKNIKVIMNGATKTISVCTRCMRSKKIVRAI